MVRPLLALLALCGLVAAPAACAAPSSAGVGSNDADFTSEPSATPDVPRYSDADVVPDFGARMRVSLGGAPFTESQAVGSLSIQRDVPTPFIVGGQLSVRFGRRGDATVTPGTYTCAESDGAVSLIERTADSTLVARAASSCTVVIDEVKPAKGSAYVRVYGRFEASANPPTGLPTASRGAFAGDFPVPH